MGQRPDEIGRSSRPGGETPEIEAASQRVHEIRASDSESPEEIRRDLEQTRAQMSETIDAIQEKLNPDVLKDQAKEAVREATIGRAEGAMSNMINRVEEMADTAGDTARDTGSGIMETIKQNPIPAMLAGVGLGWLFTNRSSSRPSHPVYRRSTAAYPSGYPYEGRRELYRAEDRGGAIDRMRHSGEPVSQAGSGLMDTVRGNPLPSALLGLGLGWLLMNRSSGDDKDTYGYGSGTGSHYGAYEGYYEERGGMEEVREKAGETVERAQHAVEETAGRAQETVAHAADSARESVGQMVEDVQDTAGRFASQTGYRARKLEDQVQDMLRTNPLAVGGVALALGAVAGLMIPGSRREHELMGETRDNFMRQARATTEETIEKVQKVAEEVGHTVEEEAREQGLG